MSEITIKKYSPLDHKIKALIYGSSGVGKTVFGGSAPKPIFASAEWGLLSLADQAPSFVEIKTLADLSGLYDFLKNEKHDYETLVIDSISEINEIIKNNIVKEVWTMSIKHWWELLTRITRMLKKFKELDMHVIFIAHEQFEKDDEKILKILPSLSGKFSLEVAYLLDIVWYLYVDKFGARKMITKANSLYVTKDRTGLIGNDSDLNFTTWVENIKKIKIWKQTTLLEHSTDNWELEQPEAPILPVEADPSSIAISLEVAGEGTKPIGSLKPTPPNDPISPPLVRQLFAIWENVWNLQLTLYPLEKDEDGFMKYAPHTKDLRRKELIMKKFNKWSFTDLTVDEGKTLVAILTKKELELKDVEAVFIWGTEDMKKLWEEDLSARKLAKHMYKAPKEWEDLSPNK